MNRAGCPAHLLYTFRGGLQAFSSAQRDFSSAGDHVFRPESPSISASAQSDRLSSTGSRRMQRSVALYSTRTGTSGYACRYTRSSPSSSRRAAESTVLLMPSSLARRAL